jgi:hypothetical protein
MPLQVDPVRSKVNWVSVGESLVVDCTESRGWQHLPTGGSLFPRNPVTRNRAAVSPGVRHGTRIIPTSQPLKLREPSVTTNLVHVSVGRIATSKKNRSMVLKVSMRSPIFNRFVRYALQFS